MDAGYPYWIKYPTVLLRAGNSEFLIRHVLSLRAFLYRSHEFMSKPRQIKKRKSARRPDETAYINLCKPSPFRHTFATFAAFAAWAKGS